MLTPEENELLTRVGPGTPCGALLRRYWQPACYVGELSADEPTKPVTIMGEDLVVYRLPDGGYACIEEHCAHRCTSLAYGFVERDGLRCAYHGWKYDATGQCVEQPFEPAGSTFKDRIKLTAYPAQALGGLVFIYMGPPPAPVLPPWDVLAWTDGRRLAQRQELLNCNWLQAQENSADVTHTYFLHSHALYQQGHRDRGVMRLYRPFERYGFQPFEWGQLKSWEYSPNAQWPAERAGGNPLIFPNVLRNIGYGHDMHFRVPQDDTHTHIFVIRFDPGEPYASPEELANPPIEDHPTQYRPDGRHLMTNFFSQDRMAWETQGRIMDRTREHLGASDRGIILYRQTLLEQIKRVQEGHDPLGVIRDPSVTLIELPMWVVDDGNNLQGDRFAAQAGWAKTGQPMSRYFDARHEQFEVPDGAAKTPGALS
jgi:5,5'-dehydrodivanillate O-demethylase